MYYLLGEIIGFASAFISGESVLRALRQASNIALPNEVLDANILVEALRRGLIDSGFLKQELLIQGIDDKRASLIVASATRLLDAPPLAASLLRGNITKEDYYAQMSKLGYTETSARLMFELQQQRLDPESVITAWRRGHFKEGDQVDYFDDLRQQGITDDRIDVLKTVTKFYPSPTDIVRFLLRDVFIPEYVHDYGMDQEYPVDADEVFGKAGVDHDIAMLFWKAHWELPSISQAYEMYQRGVIEQKDLHRLLRAQGVEPYWRDKLVAVSYNPLTRVDIRRMHKLGVLKDEDLQKAYQNIGYSPTDALRLKDFTLALTKAGLSVDQTKHEVDQAELLGISKANVIAAYEDNIIDRKTADSYLDTLGVEIYARELLLSLSDYKIDKANDTIEISVIEGEYLNGAITVDDAYAALNKLNLPAGRSEALIYKWVKRTKTKDKRPTVAEMTNFFALGIIDQETFASELSLMGYGKKYVEYFVKAELIKLQGKK